MRIPLAVVLSFSSLFTGCSRAGGTTNTKRATSIVSQQTSKADADLTKETAVRIAEEDAARAYGGLDQFTVVPCEQPAFWRIVFEPKDFKASITGPEYVVDKRIGSIVSKHDLRLSWEIKSELPPPSHRIDRQHAIAIASRDATTSYGSLAEFDLTVCEFMRIWRVIYSPRKGLNGGGPEYVIDKFSGKIIEKKYYQ